MNEIVVQGILYDPRHIELAEPVTGLTGDVDVVLRSRRPIKKKSGETVLDVMRRLGPGTRSKEDIDRQIREERDSWGDR